MAGGRDRGRAAEVFPVVPKAATTAAEVTDATTKVADMAVEALAAGTGCEHWLRALAASSAAEVVVWLTASVASPSSACGFLYQATSKACSMSKGLLLPLASAEAIMAARPRPPSVTSSKPLSAALIF